MSKKLDSPKKKCEHKDTSPSSDPLIWYICHDCGAHLNQKFEVIPASYHATVNEVLKTEKIDSETLKKIKNLAQEESDFYDKHGCYSFWSDKLKVQRIKEKPPEPCKKCKHFIPNINKLGHSYCWELDLKMAYDYPSVCVHFKPKEKTEPEKFPKVVYQLGSDSKEYMELKKKYDKLIEGFIKFIDRFEERYEGNKCGECLEYWKTIKEHYKGA